MNNSEANLIYATAKLWNDVLGDLRASTSNDDQSSSFVNEMFDSDSYVSRMRTLVLNSDLDTQGTETDQTTRDLLIGLDRLIKQNSQIAYYTNDHEQTLARLLKKNSNEQSTDVMEVLDITSNLVDPETLDKDQKPTDPSPVINIETEKIVQVVEQVKEKSETKSKQNHGN